MQAGTNHPTLIVIRGIPGSGKTYLADALQKTLGDDVVMLDPDKTDYDSQEYAEHVKTLLAQGVDKKLHAYRYLRAKAYDAIAARQTIIWNQPFTNLEIFNKMVGRLKTHASKHGTFLQILVVEVKLDPTAAKQRIIKRKEEGGHGPSDATLSQRISDYRSFSGEGYNTVDVNGDDDVSVSVASVIKALKNLPQQ